MEIGFRDTKSRTSSLSFAVKPLGFATKSRRQRSYELTTLNPGPTHQGFGAHRVSALLRISGWFPRRKFLNDEFSKSASRRAGKIVLPSPVHQRAFHQRPAVPNEHAPTKVAPDWSLAPEILSGTWEGGIFLPM